MRTEELFKEAMQLTPVRIQGGKLYRENCLGCHGSNALGDAGKVIPALAGQVERYLVKEFVDFTELDRDAPEMHRLMAHADLGRPQAWRDLAAYLTNLPPNREAQTGGGRDVERGKQSYKAYCASCHGASGEGRDEAPIPALRGQHYSYLLLQLKSFDAAGRSNVDAPLLQHMVDLSRQDMEAIADYLARLPKAAERRTEGV